MTRQEVRGLDELWRGLVWVLGLDLPQGDLTIGHMAARAVLTYVAALAMARVGERRFLGKGTAFDVILAVMFGSVVSRAITGSSPFFPALVAGLTLVLVHQAFAVIAFRFSGFGKLIKGNPRVLLRDGEIQWDAMHTSHISENDLRAALRSQAHVDDPSQVAEARLERSGDLSVIKRDGEPRVVDVAVEAGVQTVRIRLG
jgi:uncharacterized membrane protein YcaP (DUF421 family)